MKIASSLIVALLSLAGVGVAQASTFRSVSSTNTIYTNGSWSFGTIFTVGSDNVTVNSLGAFDAGKNGFASGAIQVGIFEESSRTLLASTNVLSSDSLFGDYRYSTISSLNLTSGNKYRLVAVSGSDSYSFYGTTYDTSAFTINGYQYGSGTTLSQSFGGPNTESDYGMANFQFNVAAVPEPETYAMLLAGFGLIGAAVKRRKAKQA